MNKNRLLKASIPLAITAISVALIFWLSVAPIDKPPQGPSSNAAAAATPSADPTDALAPSGAAPADAAATPDLAPVDAAGANAKLMAIQATLVRAKAGLMAASTGNHGGFVEKARADFLPTGDDLGRMLDFVANDPAARALPAALSADAQTAADHVMSLHLPTPNNQPSMVAALKALQAALTAVQQADLGNVGPARDTLILDIDRTATDVADGFHYLRSGANKKKPAPDPTPAADPLRPTGLP